MKPPQTTRLELGTSDPVGYTCTCTTKTGRTLLFYRYFSKPPLLPAHHHSKLSTPSSSSKSSSETDELEALAQWHRDLLEKWDLGGRIRVGVEGFNGTLAGSDEGVEGWLEEVCGSWSFNGLGLDLRDVSVGVDEDGDGDLEAKDIIIRERRNKFFKPTPGCKCVFGTERSVRVKKEITPMGIEGWTPREGEWNGVVELEPWEWHEIFTSKNQTQGGNEEDMQAGEEKERILIDVRNYYESRIGYFVDPKTGKDALKPAIRRFSQWPLWVRERMGDVITSKSIRGEEEEVRGYSSSLSPIRNTEAEESSLQNGNESTREKPKPKQTEIFTYCTGGIRCEKGVRFMQETLNNTNNANTNSQESVPRRTKIYTLKGGIAAYLIWMDEEIAQGRKNVKDSLFRGRNYVFDARGSTGLLESGSEEAKELVDDDTQGVEEGDMVMAPVSKCHMCGVACDRLGKCLSKGCHLVLVVCEGCQGVDGGRDIRCCGSCRELEDKDLELELERNEEDADRGADVVLRGKKVRPICDCERERERELWGDGGAGGGRGKGRIKKQGWRKEKRMGMGGREKVKGLDIRIKTF